MKEIRIAPGRVAHKNQCLICLTLDRRFNAAICSYLLENEEDKCPTNGLMLKLLNSAHGRERRQVEYKNVHLPRCTAV